MAGVQEGKAFVKNPITYVRSHINGECLDGSWISLAFILRHI